MVVLWPPYKRYASVLCIEITLWYHANRVYDYAILAMELSPSREIILLIITTELSPLSAARNVDRP